jgi:hypothetical protein
MPPQCDVRSPGTSGEGWAEASSMTYKRFYPGAQWEIKRQGRKSGEMQEQVAELNRTPMVKQEN